MTAETRNCQNCKGAFVIEPEDFQFYEKIHVPPPTWCPQCRLMRRLTWRNERALYKRTCDLCKATIVAMYPAGTPFPVYCRECWYSDTWDATTYGREYNFSRPFFEQFHDLMQVVPQIALQVSTSPGSDYVNQAADCKNCYLVASASSNEDCMYCYRVLNSKNAIDSSFIHRVEYCYECVQSLEMADSRFVIDGIGSSGLMFCTDIRNAQDCFMSSNRRQAKHTFRNKVISREQYEARMKGIDMGSYEKLEAYRKEFHELHKRRLNRYMISKNAPGCTGNAVAESAESKMCFNANRLECCSYALMLSDAKDSYDVNNGCCQMELAYECSTAGANVYNLKFSADVWPEVRNTTYSQSCRNDVSELFGCVSLRKKQYCILNRQYTKEEYEELILKIVEHMTTAPYTDKQGRVYGYGEFFPPELSLYAYNETPAQDYFPKSKSEVEAMGFRWKEPEQKHYDATVAAKDLPDHIKDVSDDIVRQIVGCAHGGACGHQCTTAFRITPQELQFYRQKNIALPRLCPNCRHYERFALINPYRLWKRTCGCGGSTSKTGSRKNSADHFHDENPCPNEFETSYAPERPEIVYCEQCYNAEVA